MELRHHHTGERGFTLMETLVTLVLVAIVTLGVFRVFTATSRSYHRGTESIDGQQNTRAALNWLSKELRGAKGFTLIRPDEVTFLSDVKVPNQARTFRLDVDDVDGDGFRSELLLIRNPADDGTPGVVVDEIAVGIDSLAFVYRDGTGASTSSRSAVQEVEIFVFTTGNQMQEEEAVEFAQMRQVGMSTRVRCRNLGKSVPTLGDVISAT
jgi:prepilin-type N-terminal cleavage/methylation domain-containing protein